MAETQIYDKLFFRIFSRPERAADLVRNVVPKPVLSKIELESIQIDERTYVDKKLRRHFSDVLIRFECADTGGVFDKDPPHESEKWRSSLQTADLISYTEERDYIPHFEPIFYDLNGVDEEKLVGTIQTVAALVFFKYIKRDFTKDAWAAGRILEYLHRLPSGSDERQLFERVVVEVKSEEETERFLAHLRERGYTEIEEDVMTFAEAKLQEGRQEGTLKDKQNVVKRQLQKKFGLSEEEAARIDRIEDLHALDAALDEIIDAEEKRQVLEKLGL